MQKISVNQGSCSIFLLFSSINAIAESRNQAGRYSPGNAPRGVVAGREKKARKSEMARFGHERAEASAGLCRPGRDAGSMNNHLTTFTLDPSAGWPRQSARLIQGTANNACFIHSTRIATLQGQKFDLDQFILHFFVENLKNVISATSSFRRKPESSGFYMPARISGQDSPMRHSARLIQDTSNNTCFRYSTRITSLQGQKFHLGQFIPHVSRNI